MLVSARDHSSPMTGATLRRRKRRRVTRSGRIEREVEAAAVNGEAVSKDVSPKENGRARLPTRTSRRLQRKQNGNSDLDSQKSSWNSDGDTNMETTASSTEAARPPKTQTVSLKPSAKVLERQITRPEIYSTMKEQSEGGVSQIAADDVELSDNDPIFDATMPQVSQESDTRSPKLYGSDKPDSNEPEIEEPNSKSSETCKSEVPITQLPEFALTFNDAKSPELQNFTNSISDSDLPGSTVNESQSPELNAVMPEVLNTQSSILQKSDMLNSTQSSKLHKSDMILSNTQSSELHKSDMPNTQSTELYGSAVPTTISPELHSIVTVMPDPQSSGLHSKAMPDPQSSGLHSKAMPDPQSSGLHNKALPDLQSSGLHIRALPVPHADLRISGRKRRKRKLGVDEVDSDMIKAHLESSPESSSVEHSPTKAPARSQAPSPPVTSTARTNARAQPSAPKRRRTAGKKEDRIVHIFMAGEKVHFAIARFKPKRIHKRQRRSRRPPSRSPEIHNMRIPEIPVPGVPAQNGLQNLWEMSVEAKIQFMLSNTSGRLKNNGWQALVHLLPSYMKSHLAVWNPTMDRSVFYAMNIAALGEFNYHFLNTLPAEHTINPHTKNPFDEKTVKAVLLLFCEFVQLWPADFVHEASHWSRSGKKGALPGIAFLPEARQWLRQNPYTKVNNKERARRRRLLCAQVTAKKEEKLKIAQSISPTEKMKVPKKSTAPQDIKRAAVKPPDIIVAPPPPALTLTNSSTFQPAASPISLPSPPSLQSFGQPAMPSFIDNVQLLGQANKGFGGTRDLCVVATKSIISNALDQIFALQRRLDFRETLLAQSRQENVILRHRLSRFEHAAVEQAVAGQQRQMLNPYAAWPPGGHSHSGGGHSQHGVNNGHSQHGGHSGGGHSQHGGGSHTQSSGSYSQSSQSSGNSGHSTGSTMWPHNLSQMHAAYMNAANHVSATTHGQVATPVATQPLASTQPVVAGVPSSSPPPPPPPLDQSSSRQTRSSAFRRTNSQSQPRINLELMPNGELEQSPKSNEAHHQIPENNEQLGESRLASLVNMIANAPPSQSLPNVDMIGPPKD
eukprot:923869_1